MVQLLFGHLEAPLHFPLLVPAFLPQQVNRPAGLLKGETESFLNLTVALPHPSQGQGCTLSPPHSQSSTKVQTFPPTQHPEFIACCDLLFSSPPGSPSPATGVFKDAAKAPPPPRGPAVWICFYWSCIHGPADAACTHRHTPQALG